MDFTRRDKGADAFSFAIGNISSIMITGVGKEVNFINLKQILTAFSSNGEISTISYPTGIDIYDHLGFHVNSSLDGVAYFDDVPMLDDGTGIGIRSRYLPIRALFYFLLDISILGLSLANGFVKAGTLSWDAYNESKDLIKHTEAFKEFYGYYPQLIQVDKIYGSNENRTWCKERNIRLTVSPKGPETKKSQYQKKKIKKEYAERNQIEGKIGQAKQGYKLNQIKAKLKDTSQSWIALILFVTNVTKFAEIHGFYF